MLSNYSNNLCLKGFYCNPVFTSFSSSMNVSGLNDSHLNLFMKETSLNIGKLNYHEYKASFNTINQHLEILNKKTITDLGLNIKNLNNTKLQKNIINNLNLSKFKSKNIDEDIPVATIQIEELDSCFSELKKAEKNMRVCETSSLYQHNGTASVEIPKVGNLEFNVKLAHEILSEVIDTVPFSSNNLDRSRNLIENRAKKQGVSLENISNNIPQIFSKIEACVFESRTLINRECRALDSRENFSLYKIVAKFASYGSAGNCGEIAAVGFFKGMQKGLWNTHLDLVSIENGDHAFLVIGREAGSDPKDYKTWGPNAVVVDGWANKVFKLSEVERYLKDYLGVSLTGEPELKLFDPKEQQLGIISDNICFTEELVEFKKNMPMADKEVLLYNAIEANLKEFHSTELLQEKVDAANKLYKLCSEPDIQWFDIIKKLKGQVAHFIEFSYYWTKSQGL